MGPGLLAASAILLAFIHRSAWKVNSPKFVVTIPAGFSVLSHRCPPLPPTSPQFGGGGYIRCEDSLRGFVASRCNSLRAELPRILLVGGVRIAPVRHRIRFRNISTGKGGRAELRNSLLSPARNDACGGRRRGRSSGRLPDPPLPPIRRAVFETRLCL